LLSSSSNPDVLWLVLSLEWSPRVYEREGFVVRLWDYYEPATAGEVSSADYATALAQLHAGMRKLNVAAPHFTDRVDQAQQLVASSDHTPVLADADRELLRDTLRNLRRGIGERGGVEQLLHGEPHPGNVLTTRTGCCSSTSRRVAVGLWNSTLPMRPKKSASTIRVSIVACCPSAGSSCWR
jgi:hypothetical protein